VERAERNLAQALDLTADADQERPLLLERWARAALSQNRPREARDALHQALTTYRQRGDTLAAGRTLSELHFVLRELGDPHQEETLGEALQLLEAEPPGLELVFAYTQQARARFFAAALEESVAAADKAIGLAAQLDLPQPAAALGYRGFARASRGERQGVEEMQQALSLAVEQGEGRSAAILYNNLAIAVWLYEGPQAIVDLRREGIEFAQRRGITAVLDTMAAGQTGFLAELGRIEDALTDAALLADRAEQASSVLFVFPRSVQLRLLAECGRHAQAPDPEPMLMVARDSGEPLLMAAAVAGAATLLHAREQPKQARDLLNELDRIAASRTDLYYASMLPSLIRSALALTDPKLATRLTEGVHPGTPLAQHALHAARAALAEVGGDQAEAASLYAQAAERWREFGDVPERAYALLGQGRCLTTLANPDAEQPLRQARELFKSMGYKPALAETDALLAQTATAAS
jgi:tetratricopeptide (TPR) repeat protein